MKIRRFLANSTTEAINLVKKELGAEAVILRTRTVPGENSLKGQNGDKVEVTAAIDYEAVSEKDISEKGATNGGAAKRWERLEGEIHDLKSFLWALQSGDRSLENLLNVTDLKGGFSHYVDFGLNVDAVTALVRRSGNETRPHQASARRRLRESLFKVLENIRVDSEAVGPPKKRIYSFIGPTGVGKTTTLAKLAANNVIDRKKRAVLITVDTFRIAAVAQLEIYARILGVPLEVAANRKELEKAIQKHDQCPLIFIDTAGRSPNNVDDIDRIGRVLDIGETIHHYLVLSATTQYENLVNIEQRFSVVPYESFVFTKLDEVNEVSSMINFLISKRKPVSFFTTGQQVPEDIEPASRRKLAEMILTRKRTMALNSAREVN
jgi:flagellar biosynthesis protein FlhF